MTKSRLVLIPAPGMGHLFSAVEFAKLLINYDDHHDRLTVTVFVVKSTGSTNLDSYINSLTSSPNFPPSLQLIPIQTDESHYSPYPHQVALNTIPLVKQALSQLLQETRSNPHSPRITAFVVDMLCTAFIDIADDLAVPSLVFYTSGAAFLGLNLHLRQLQEQGALDTTSSEFIDSYTELAIPSFANPVPSTVLPSAVMQKEWQGFFEGYVRGLRKAKGVIVNTFEELESHALHTLSDVYAKIYPVGPIFSEKDDHMDARGLGIMEWLDEQPESSVLFLCFGSRGYFGEDQVREIGKALERSGVRFLWSLRRPPSEGSGRVTEYADPAEVLPEGFLDRTAKIGRVIGWAPQAQVLAHKAVGGFVSHCGWNSILEGVYFGVPIATWPLYAEQQTNAFQLVRELKMGVEISLDYRMDFKNGKEQGVIDCERIEKGIKELMERESETRKKTKLMSELGRKALLEGGSSYSHLTRFIDDVLNNNI